MSCPIHAEEEMCIWGKDADWLGLRGVGVSPCTKPSLSFGPHLFTGPTASELLFGRVLGGGGRAGRRTPHHRDRARRSSPGRCGDPVIHVRSGDGSVCVNPTQAEPANTCVCAHLLFFVVVFLGVFFVFLSVRLVVWSVGRLSLGCPFIAGLSVHCWVVCSLLGCPFIWLSVVSWG